MADQREPELPDDYRLLTDSPLYIVAASVPAGQDLILRVERVTSGEVIGEGGRKSTKGLIYFFGHDKPMIVNATRGKVIAKLYGKSPRGWLGQWLALYRSVTAKGDPCIAVRQRNPKPAELTDEQKAQVAELCGRIAGADDADVLEAIIKPHRDAIAGMGPHAISAVAAAKSKRLAALAAKETKPNG